MLLLKLYRPGLLTKGDCMKDLVSFIKLSVSRIEYHLWHFDKRQDLNNNEYFVRKKKTKTKLKKLNPIKGVKVTRALRKLNFST